MKNTMSEAWKIANKAANRFGGKAIEYFSMSLKLAHKGLTATLLMFNSSDNKSKRITKYLKTFIIGILSLLILTNQSLVMADDKKVNKYLMHLCRAELENVIGQSIKLASDTLGVFTSDVNFTHGKYQTLPSARSSSVLVGCEVIAHYVFKLEDNNYKFHTKISYNIARGDKQAVWDSFNFELAVAKWDIEHSTNKLLKSWN